MPALHDDDIVHIIMGKRRRVGDDAHCKSLRSLIASHKRRADQHGQCIDYTASDLLQLAQDTTHCPYCGDPIKPGKYQYDHKKPLSRNGSASISNLQVLCARCNRRKHMLDAVEYQLLTEHLISIANEVGDSFIISNVLRRLAGSRY